MKADVNDPQAIAKVQARLSLRTDWCFNLPTPLTLSDPELTPRAGWQVSSYAWIIA